MNRGFEVFRCVQCDARLFPQRLLCPRCHGARFEPERVYEGVVDEVSVIRHMVGQTDWTPRRIANVRTTNGPMLTVGLLDESGSGTVIELLQEDAAPFGRAKSQ
ncbi:MAG TPA: hypothetical protein VHG27_00140 [Xanthobacteraceae bacterium]|nr:hypothetical protein [Xanthobacteraceae bacterium]